MKAKIVVGVMGSAGNSITTESLAKLEPLTKELAKALAVLDCILLTGETSGISRKVAQEAKALGVLTVGISPAHNAEEQSKTYKLSEQVSDLVIYTGFGLKGRNVINIRSADIVIILSGSIGTLNEFTIAYDEGKVIGILEGTGGVADEVKSLTEKLAKTTSAKLIFNKSPSELLGLCVEEVRKEEPKTAI